MENKDSREVISDTCLSISDISDKTIKELKQEIKKIENDDRLTNKAKAMLINEAEVGIERFEGIKKKVKNYCLSEFDLEEKLKKEKEEEQEWEERKRKRHRAIMGGTFLRW